MKRRSSELQHEPNGFQLTSIQNISEKMAQVDFCLFGNAFSIWLAILYLKIGIFVLIKVYLTNLKEDWTNRTTGMLGIDRGNHHF